MIRTAIAVIPLCIAIALISSLSSGLLYHKSRSCAAASPIAVADVGHAHRLVILAESAFAGYEPGFEIGFDGFRAAFGPVA